MEDLLAEVMAVEEEGEGDDDLDSSSSSSGAASEEEAALIDEDDDDEDLPLQTLGDDALDAELSSHEQQLGGGLEAHLPEASDLLDDELNLDDPFEERSTTASSRPPFRSIRSSRRTILYRSLMVETMIRSSTTTRRRATPRPTRRCELSSRSRTKQPTARSQTRPRYSVVALSRTMRRMTRTSTFRFWAGSTPTRKPASRTRP